MTAIKGRVRKFGDNIDTDIIAPGSVLQLPIDEMKKYFTDAGISKMDVFNYNGELIGIGWK